MKLDDTQRQKVTDWINEGLKLSEIQVRLERELGLRMTYLDVRLLVDELKLMPKDPVVVAPPEPPKPAEAPEAISPEIEPEPEELPSGASNVSVTVDQLTRQGALVSGTVTFSDRKTASWFLDEMGRLGISAGEKGYKPSQADVQAFQIILQKELQKLGM